MTLSLTPETDRETLASALGRQVDRAAIRTGDPRRRRLQKNVRRLSRDWELRVVVDETIATTDLASGADQPDTVRITGRALPQPVTDYDPRAWDWLVQRALGVHEAGHVRYTDFTDWERRLKSLQSGDEGLAHTLFNALEDGAVERQIITRWPNYEGPLRALRANRLETATLGIPDPERGGFLYPLAHAVHAAVLDRWLATVYDLAVGVLDSLVDPADQTHHFKPGSGDPAVFRETLLPAIEQVVPAVLSTPVATERNAQIARFVETVLEHLDEAGADGRTQQQGRAGEGQTGEGMPDDSREHDSGANAAEAEALGETDPGEAETSREEPELTPPDAVEVVEDLQARAAETAADDAMAEAGLSEAAVDELEELAALTDGEAAAGEDLHAIELGLPDEPWSADPERVARIEADAQPLARIFRKRLQHERRSAVRRGTRRGRLDAQRLYRTGVEPMPAALRRRRDEPEEKDYYMAFVLDRSASMRRQIHQAETAMGLLLFALESVGVETMLLELFDSAVRVAKPFGVPPATQRDRLFHGRAGGGTPLTDVLQVVRRRLDREADRGTRKAMFVVTDDAPADPEAFAAAVEATTFPVLGVNLTAQPSTATYTRSVAADPGADLQAALTQLATEILL
jgi:Mg-chelatase subunit ChlD